MASENALSETLYLDTARLGLISPTAQQLQIQFARLASDPRSLLYFQEFISTGVPKSLPALELALGAFDAWHGVQGLEQAVRHLVGAPEHSKVFMASRSATLMKLAAKSIASQCQRVLTIDLLWPPYRRILIDAVRNKNKAVHICPLRTAALHREDGRQVLTESICEAFDQHHCDGLLLPLVDHHGVSMPIADIVRALLERDCFPKQVVVDASQALGHVPIALELLGCDLLIGGTHKWLGSHEPLGVGVSLRPLAVNGYRMSAIDPLLRLTQEQTGDCQSRHGETAAISPLLSAAGLSSIAHQKRFGGGSLRDEAIDAHSQPCSNGQAGGWEFRETEEHHGILLARTPWRETPGQQATLQNTFQAARRLRHHLP